MFISIPVILPQVSLGFLVYLNPKYKFLSLMPLMLVNLSANKKVNTYAYKPKSQIKQHAYDGHFFKIFVLLLHKNMI